MFERLKLITSRHVMINLRTMRWAVLAGSVQLLSGCMVGPDYHPRDVQVADEWMDLADQSLSGDPADHESWWTAFDDPVLDQLIHMAYGQNLTLRSAGIRIAAARYQKAIAVGQIFPQVQEANGGYTRTQESANKGLDVERRFDTWQLGFDMSWELDLWGKFRRSIEAADANLDVSIEEYNAVVVTLLGEVASTYVQIRIFQERIRLARANVELQQRSLGIARTRFKNGAVTELDADQAEALLAQTQATLPNLEASLRAASNSLCTLLGTAPHKLEDLLGDGPIPAAPAEVTLGIPADLLRRRPDIRQAERQVAAQSASIGVATASLYPHFSLNGSIGLDAHHSFSDLFDKPSYGFSVGPSFSWDVFNYGRLMNNVKVQDALFEALAVDYENTVLQAQAEVESSIFQFLKSQEETRHIAVSVQAWQRSADLSMTQYREGELDFQRVINSQASLVQQQDALAQTRGAIALNLIATYKALGGGWQIRAGGPFYPDEIQEDMDTRTSWPTVLTPWPTASKRAEPREGPALPAGIERVRAPSHTPEAPVHGSTGARDNIEQ